jgi:hypothetical protein
MVAAYVKYLGDTSNKTSGTTLGQVLQGGGSAAGNLIVASIIFDNAATASKPIVSSISKMAGETNNWVFLGAARSTSTSAGAFASGELWAIQTTVAWTGTITVTLDTAVTQKAVLMQEFSGAQAVLRSTVGTNYSTTTTAASATTTGTAPAIGDLAIGLIFGSNVASQMAGDNDTTAGSWSAVAGLGSTGGNVATNNFGIAQYKILTAATAQTYNNQAAMTAGNGSIVAILQPIPDPAITQAAYQFFDDAGTESGAASLAALNTSVVGQLVAGDGFGVLRVRLQNTSANTGQVSDDYQLQWEKNASGTWTTVTTGGTTVLGYNNTNLTDGGATTNRLGAGSGSFVPGKVSETGDVPNLAITGSNYTELVYALTLKAANLADADTLRFRVLRNGVTTVMTYTVTPTITIKGPVAMAGTSGGLSGSTGTLSAGKFVALSNVLSGTTWTYDFTTMPDGPQPATLTTWGGALAGRIASGHFMCDVDWFFTKVYDTLLPDQNEITHLTAMELSFQTASGGVWLVFAGNADMSEYNAIEIHQDGSWLFLYNGGGFSGAPNLSAFTLGTTYKIYVTYNEVTSAVEVFINDVSAATGTYGPGQNKIGNRSGWHMGGNLDVWITKFYYGPQSAGTPGAGGGGGCTVNGVATVVGSLDVVATPALLPNSRALEVGDQRNTEGDVPRALESMVAGGPVALAGSTSGLSATAGTIAVALPLVAASTPGTSTTTGVMAVAKALVATTPGTSTTTGAAAIAKALSAVTPAGLSTTTGTMAVARAFVGSSNGLSTTTGALARAVPLSGTSDGSSTDTGVSVVAVALSGSSIGTSSTVGDLGGASSRALAGQTDGTSATTGSMAVFLPLSGSTGGLSTTTAAMATADALVGTTPGSSTTTGALAVAIPLAGSTAASSTTTGNMAVAKSLAGTTAASSTTTGVLARAIPLSGTSTGLSATTGTSVSAIALAGTSAGTSQTTGVLDGTAATPLTGTTAGLSTTTGALDVAKALVVTTPGTSTTTAAVAIARSLSAVTPAGSSTTTGAMVVAKALAGSTTGGSTTTGTLVGSSGMGGSSTGASTTTGTMAAIAKALSGSAGGTSTTTGAMVSQAPNSMSGVAAGGSTTTGILGVTARMSASAGGSSTTTGALSRSVPMTGVTVPGSSTAIGTMAVSRSLAGSTGGSSTTTAAVRVAKALAGSSGGLSATQGALVMKRALVGASVGLSASTGTLTVVFIAPVYGLYNGQPFDAMQYGDKIVTAWLLIPS